MAMTLPDHHFGFNVTLHPALSSGSLTTTSSAFSSIFAFPGVTTLTSTTTTSSSTTSLSARSRNLRGDQTSTTTSVQTVPLDDQDELLAGLKENGTDTRGTDQNGNVSEEMSLEERLAMAREAYMMPGALPAHTRLCPDDRESLVFSGRPSMQEPLKTPPDGLCAIYCFLAAQNVRTWSKLPLDSMGFITDPVAENFYKAKALEVRSDILRSMRAEGSHAGADRLAKGGYPGDDEFGFYSNTFGGAFIVSYLSNALPSVIHGSHLI